MKRSALIAAFMVGVGAIAAIVAVTPSISTTGGQVWRTDESVAFADARESGRHVLIDFGAEWCAPCKELEEILAQEQVASEMTRSFVPLRFDVTRLTPEDDERKARYRVFRLPTLLFVDVEGRELARYTPEKVSTDTFLAEMRRVVAANPPDSGS